MTSIQKFFNDNPVIAGIALFLVIAFIVSITSLIYFLKSRSKRKKPKKEKPIVEEIVEQQPIEESIVEEEPNQSEYDERFTYFILNFDTSGNLFLENTEGEVVNENPSKEEFMSILINEEQKLILPEDKVEIQLIINNEENENDDKFRTSRPVIDTNLFIFNLFIKFMQDVDMPWAISKFK